MASRWIMLPVAWAVVGCSWSRFDDVGNNAPVVLLNKPAKMNGGFGVTVAAATLDDQARVVVGGADGLNEAAVFQLGSGTQPLVDATDTACTQGADDAPCYLGNSIAGLAEANDGTGADKPEKLCFILGIGQADGASSYGLSGRCANATEYTLPVPKPVLTDLIQNDLLFQGPTVPPPPLVLGTDKEESAVLVAGAPSHQFAWFYKPLDFLTPYQVTPPGTPEADFGTTVTALAFGIAADAGVTPSPSGLIAVGAPSAGHVWLFGRDDGKPVGCLGGPSLFGRTLASGRVDADDFDDLVVADGTNVTVFSGAALAGLAPAANITCSLAALPANAIIASFGCGSRDTIAGCPGGFGSALAVGDLDGDGDGEVLVGAPGMKVRGTQAAGAVLVYDAEGDHPEQLTDQLFLSSQQDHDALGTSIAAARITDANVIKKKRDVVVAGAPGNGRAAIFYCSVLLESGVGGNRCQ